MSPHGYIQLFVYGLLCSGVISTENVTCTTPRAQSNIHVNQVLGDWFVGQAQVPATVPLHERECNIMNVRKINETTLELTEIDDGKNRSAVFSIENAENAGTWHSINSNLTMEVILSSDGTAMAMVSCIQDIVKLNCILMAKQLPISSEHAGITGSHCHYTWKSEATCRLP